MYRTRSEINQTLRESGINIIEAIRQWRAYTPKDRGLGAFYVALGACPRCEGKTYYYATPSLRLGCDCRTSEIKPLDRVKVSAKFLRSIGQYTGPLPFARGEVLVVKVLSSGTRLAIVDWGKDKDAVPDRFNVRNLVREGQLEAD